MGAGSTERRQISTAAAVVVAVALGAAMAYLGFLLAGVGAHALNEGNVLLGLAALVVGVALVGLPVAVLISQLRSALRRHG